MARSWCAVDDGTLRLVAIPSGKELHRFPAEPARSSLAFSPDGRQFAIGYQSGKVRVVPTSGVGPISEWQASDRRIEQVLFPPGGKELLTVPLGRDTQVWRLAARPRLVTSLPSGFSEATAMDLSADGTLLVAATGDTEVRFYDTKTWKEVRSYRDLILETFAVAFTRDQTQVLVAGADKQITVLDASTGKLVRSLPRQDDPVRELLPLEDGDSVVAILLRCRRQEAASPDALEPASGDGSPPRHLPPTHRGRAGARRAVAAQQRERANARDLEALTHFSVK